MTPPATITPEPPLSRARDFVREASTGEAAGMSAMARERVYFIAMRGNVERLGGRMTRLADVIERMEGRRRG